jgi:hypothetical protein
LENQSGENREVKKRSGFIHVFEILYSPTRTFEQVIESGQAWLYPAILFGIILDIGIILSIPFMQEQMREALLLFPNSGIASEQLVIVMLAFSLFFTPLIAFLLAYIIPSSIYLFFGNFVFEGRAGFRQILNVTAFASMPFIVGRLLESVISGFSGLDWFTFGPAMLLPAEYQNTFLGHWLGMFDVFIIWQIALTIIGLSALYRHTRAKTAAWLIPLYLAAYTFFALATSFMQRFASEWGGF